MVCETSVSTSLTGIVGVASGEGGGRKLWKSRVAPRSGVLVGEGSRSSSDIRKFAPSEMRKAGGFISVSLMRLERFFLVVQT